MLDVRPLAICDVKPIGSAAAGCRLERPKRSALKYRRPAVQGGQPAARPTQGWTDRQSHLPRSRHSLEGCPTQLVVHGEHKC